METTNVLDKVESLVDSMEGTIRNGGISNDTSIIAQGLLLNALVMICLNKRLKDINASLNFHRLNIYRPGK